MLKQQNVIYSKVGVSIDNDYWEQWIENSNKGGISKRDENYLTKVIAALEQALEQAKTERQCLI